MALRLFSRGRKQLINMDNNEQNLHPIGEEDLDCEGQKQHLAFKAGFITLKERINSLNDQRNASKIDTRTTSNNNNNNNRQPNRQYATLSELFSSKFHQSENKSNLTINDNSEEHSFQRKPKIPIMKLTKDDWNVKFWEDRLSNRKRKQEISSKFECQTSPPLATTSRSNKPRQQIEVFHGRIEDVAQKLERVREGVPQDLELYQLKVSNKSFKKRSDEKFKSSHEWTDLLKEELAKGTHNPKQLKAAASASSTSLVVKSPLGRPIRRIFDKDDDEDDGEY